MFLVAARVVRYFEVPTLDPNNAKTLCVDSLRLNIKVKPEDHWSRERSPEA